MISLCRSALMPALLLAGCAGAPVAAPLPAREAASLSAETVADAPPADSAVIPATSQPDTTTDAQATRGDRDEPSAAAGKDAPDEALEPAVPAVDKARARKAVDSLKPDDILMRGKASYYHLRFVGRRTASGQRYDDGAMTAAHRTLPFGTKVRVTNTRNGRSVVVTINDRGPFRPGRVIDVSGIAARALGLWHHGLAEVILSRP